MRDDMISFFVPFKSVLEPITCTDTDLNGYRIPLILASTPLPLHPSVEGEIGKCGGGASPRRGGARPRHHTGLRLDGNFFCNFGSPELYCLRWVLQGRRAGRSRVFAPTDRV